MPKTAELSLMSYVIDVETNHHLICARLGAAPWNRDFRIVLPLHFLLVLHHHTEHLGAQSRLGQRPILVSCQFGTRLVHMVL